MKATDNTPSPNGDAGRDPLTGRFTEGNPGGPGNPHAASAARFRAAIHGAITPEEMHAVARRLLAAALDGDIPACRLLLQYTIGEPERRVEVEGGEGRPLVFNIVSARKAADDGGE